MNNLEWVKIADSHQQLETLCNPLYKLQASERKVLIHNEGGKFYAFSALCPHAGFDLSKGKIDAKGNIMCPLHGYKFCIKTGKNTTGEDYKLFVYPLEIRNDGIYIGIRTSVF